jgi:DNA polymerase-3 subunit delta
LKLKARDVDRALSRPDPDIQAFVIFGPDSGLVRERANTLAGALVEDPDDPFTVTRLTEDDIKSDPAALSDAMAAMSLLGTAPLVRVRLSGDLTAVGTYLTDLDKGQTAAEARLIVEAGDLKKSSKLRKAAEDGARFLAAPCYADDARDLIKLADEMLAAEGLSLAPDARAMLAPYLEGDRALARGEIDKLILYKGLARQRPEGEATIERADIAAISAAGAEAALDQIIDPAFSGDPVSADRAYARALSAGISPVAVLRVLQRRIDQFETFHASGGDTGALVRAGAPRFGPPAEAFKRSARAWRGRRLDQARRLAFDAERSVKRSGAPVDALVGSLVLRLARAAAGTR